MAQSSRNSFIICLTLLADLSSPSLPNLHAHPGGIDDKGGHYNRKTGEYHYHSESAASPQKPKSWTGKVVGVSDGDTIKVLQNGKQVKIRLYGVDTPEKETGVRSGR